MNRREERSAQKFNDFIYFLKSNNWDFSITRFSDVFDMAEFPPRYRRNVVRIEISKLGVIFSAETDSPAKSMQIIRAAIRISGK